MTTRNVQFINFCGVNLQLQSGSSEHYDLYAGKAITLELTLDAYETLYAAPSDVDSIPSVHSQPLLLPDFSTVESVILLGRIAGRDQDAYCGHMVNVDGIDRVMDEEACETPFMATEIEGKYAVVGSDYVNKLIAEGARTQKVYLEYSNLDAASVAQLLKAKALYASLKTPYGKAVFLQDADQDMQDNDGEGLPWWGWTMIVLFIILVILAVIGVIVFIVKKTKKDDNDSFGDYEVNYDQY